MSHKKIQFFILNKRISNHILYICIVILTPVKTLNLTWEKIPGLKKKFLSVQVEKRIIIERHKTPAEPRRNDKEGHIWPPFHTLK